MTIFGLNMLVEGLEAMAKDLREKITAATRDLEEIKQETNWVSQEIETLLHELKEIQEMGLKEARPAQYVFNADSDMKIISPPRRNTHT